MAEDRGAEPDSVAELASTVAPEETGSFGNQTADANPNQPGTGLVVGKSPVDSHHLGAVLGEHVQAGSPTTMAFAVAAFRDAHASRDLLGKQLSRVADDRDATHERYHAEAARAAVLEARLELSSQFKRFQAWAFGIGGVLAGAGFGSAVQAAELTWMYGLLIVAGLAVMWLGAPIPSEKR